MSKDAIARRDTFVPLVVEDATQTHQSLIVGASAITLSLPLNAAGILLQAVTQNIRFTLDGTVPTATRGFQLKAGDPPLYIGLDTGITLKFIREAAGAVLEYEYGIN